ncbi:MAG: membrane protein insertase YidC [bacterium]|nr:membrane protein insertase YidC [bacterium]
MEKRLILAIVLSAAVMIGWWAIFPPPKPEPKPVPPQTGEEVAQPEREPADRAERPAEVTQDPGAEPEPAQPVGAEMQEQIRLDNGIAEVVFTNEGGSVLAWTLANYTGEDGNRLNLIPEFVDNRLRPLAIEIDPPSLAEEINAALFRHELETVYGDDGAEGQKVNFEWADGRGLEVRKSFTFWDREWLVDVEVEVNDRGRLLPARLSWGPGFSARGGTKEKGTHYYSGSGVWNRDGLVTHLKKRGATVKGAEATGDVRWAGLEDQYFAALVVPNEQPLVTARWRGVEVLPIVAPGEDEPDELKQSVFSVSVTDSGAQLYVGPKDYRMLARVGHELEGVVWFSSNGFLYQITKYLFFGLLWIHDHIAANWGLAIILATLILRVLLFPVNQYSMVSMKRAQLQMQRLQPKIKAIKAKYKKKDSQTRAKVNQETMELYKSEGVNPMGGITGCLPMLAQFPILIGFYNMLTVAIEIRGEPFFGWIQDLSRQDPLYITPLLMGVTMFVQQKMAMNKVKDPQQLQQQRMMMFMPIMFTFICIQMPAGMVLYWFMNNILGIGQQWLVNRTTGRLEAAAQKA